jgi:hypothetical protein
MGSKRSSIYKSLFQQLKAIAAKINLQFLPKMIMSDFESGLISALKVEVSYNSVSA